VAEVVEGAERFLDASPRKRRPDVALRELAGLEWSSLRRVGEDEIVIGAVRGALPLLLDDGERAWPELDDAT
jgi:hypothetical protein